MKKKYLTPSIETTIVEVENGFLGSQQKPADWEDL